MICAIHQPNFLPWLGFFHKITNCDCFVLFDSTQVMKGSTFNRSKIKLEEKECLLTIPMITKGRFKQTIKDTSINENVNWRSKHLKSIEHAYKKSPFFHDYYPGLERLYLQKEGNLCEFNIKLIRYMADCLGVKVKITRSSDLKTEGMKNELLISICKAIGADTYLSGTGARDYMDIPLFNKKGIKVIYQDFKYPQYDQLGDKFIYNLSILDLLFNKGGESLKILVGGNDG